MKSDSERAVHARSSNSSLSATAQQMQPADIVLPYQATPWQQHQGSSSPIQHKVSPREETQKK